MFFNPIGESKLGVVKRFRLGFGLIVPSLALPRSGIMGVISALAGTPIDYYYHKHNTSIKLSLHHLQFLQSLLGRDGSLALLLPNSKSRDEK
jgi:hypothetical protein